MFNPSDHLVSTMKYNTQQRRLPLPEYGRSVQNMVDHALTITDREERQRCANTIVNIMGGMYPHQNDQPDFKHKLWDHLAIMSDFKLDIDYPYEVIRKDNLDNRPAPVAYQSSRVRYKHYGHYLESLIRKASEMPEGDMKQHLVALLCNQMKKAYMSWNKDLTDEQIIADDLRELSKGKLEMTAEIRQLMAERLARATRPRFVPRNNYRKNNRQQGRR